MNANSLNQKATILVVWLLAVPVCAAQRAGTLAATNPAPLTAAELPVSIAAAPDSSENRSLALTLLQKLAETMAKLQSFICVEEGSTEKQARYTEPRSAVLNGNTRNLRRTEFRMDGNRYSISFRRWGNISSAKEFVPEARGSRNSYLWDGKTYFCNYIDTRLNEEEARQKRWLPELWWEFSRRDGFPDVDLAKASSLSARTKMESVGRAKCFVIEAVTPVSDETVTPAVHSTVYDTLWIDPEHGYNIVQATRLNKYERGSNSASLDRVVCKEIEGVWMPVEGDRRRSYSFANGDYDRNVTHLKITKMTLNPDHKALRSFVPELKNGAPVILNPRVGMSVPLPRLQPVWQDGRVVDRQGKVLFDMDGGLTNTNSDKTMPSGRK